MSPETCPHCSASMRGEPIPEKYCVHKDHCPLKTGADRCFCFPYGDATHFSRVMGHEIRGVYDGTLFWSCPDCWMAWPRWNDGLGRLSVASLAHAAAHNAEVTA